MTVKLTFEATSFLFILIIPLILKKLSVIFSFILIILFSAGGYFIHKCYLSSYKKEFKSYISHHKKDIAVTYVAINPSELYINSNSITWEDNNKEIIYKGILYDIISINNKGGKVILTTISDVRETALKKEFASLYELDSSKSKRQPFELLKNFFALKYVVNHFEFNYSILVTSIDLPTHLFQLSTIFFELDTPPPSCFE